MWTSVFDASLGFIVFRVSTPILLAAVGGLVCQVAGVVNIGLEGMMLAAAFFGAVVSAATGSAWLGLAAAVGAGLAMALVFAVFTQELKADPIIVGFALIILAAGLTVFLMSTWFGDKGSYSPATIVPIPRLEVPGLRSVPVVGTMLSGQNVLVYAGWLAVALTHVLLYKTTLGLRLRSVGENPEAAAAVGIDVRRLRYFAVLWSGLFCGLAGANLSLGYMNMFVRGMTNGRGFIALAAVLFGGQTPVGTFGASVLFGFFEGLATRLQAAGLPSTLMLMIPYLATVAALVLIAVRRRREAAVVRLPGALVLEGGVQRGHSDHPGL